MFKELSTILITILCAVSLLKGIKDIWHFRHDTIPHQLVDLVRQAHLDVPFRTLWDIEVSSEMRNALLAPLTAEQINELSHSGEDIIKRSINCRVISHKLKDGELSGVVSVSVKYYSQSGTHNYAFSNEKLRIVVSHIGPTGISKRWSVTSVERE